jgi:hypothetical protein
MMNTTGELKLIRLQIVCRVCGHEWGVRLTDANRIFNDDNYECVKCRKAAEFSKGECDYGRTTEYATAS